MAKDPTGGDLHDFDFLFGRWTIANRRLKQRWVASDDWDEFPSSSCCEARMGGVVNVDEYTYPTKGFSGTAIRLFDLHQRIWSIYWITSRDGLLTPPVFGGFTGDRGTFYGEDVDDGASIKVRYRWMRNGPDAARWEQAFSKDTRSWETNWVMDFARSKR